MNEANRLMLWVLLKNTIMVICFTVLAVVFQKWWIIFFSALFFNPFHTEITITEKEEE